MCRIASSLNESCHWSPISSENARAWCPLHLESCAQTIAGWDVNASRRALHDGGGRAAALTGQRTTRLAAPLVTPVGVAPPALG
jgi:hypothetical protein